MQLCIMCHILIQSYIIVVFLIKVTFSRSILPQQSCSIASSTRREPENKLPIYSTAIALALFNSPREGVKKWIFYGQLFVTFFVCVIFILESQVMILCVLKWILHQKSHFHPTTRTPNSFLLMLLLCHKTVRQRYSRGVKGIKNAFLRPLTMR